MKTIVVHNGIYHPDDIFAAATLELYLESRGERSTLIRTRDESIIATADFVCDVGGVYDPLTQRFDHHQIGGAGTRPNGIQYASFGLVWKQYGLLLCADNQWVVDFIEQKLVSGIDAADNGQPVTKRILEEVNEYTINDLVVSLLPTWKEVSNDETLLESFQELVALAKRIITREIIKAHGIYEGEAYVEQAYLAAERKDIIVLDSYCPWKRKLMQYPEPLICVFPTLTGTWNIYCVPEDPATFTSRFYLPESWAGLRDEELALATGISDAFFCHRGRFLAGTRTKESAILFAQKAIELSNAS